MPNRFQYDALASFFFTLSFSLPSSPLFVAKHRMFGMFRNQITIRGKAFFAVKATGGEECCASSTSFSSPFFPLTPPSIPDSESCKLLPLCLSLSFFSPPSLARACGRNFFQSGRFYVSLFNEDIKRITTWIILGRPAGVVLPTWKARE